MFRKEIYSPVQIYMFCMQFVWVETNSKRDISFLAEAMMKVMGIFKYVMSALGKEPWISNWQVSGLLWKVRTHKASRIFDHMTYVRARDNLKIWYLNFRKTYGH